MHRVNQSQSLAHKPILIMTISKEFRRKDGGIKFNFAPANEEELKEPVFQTPCGVFVQVLCTKSSLKGDGW